MLILEFVTLNINNYLLHKIKEHFASWQILNALCFQDIITVVSFQLYHFESIVFD